VTRTHLLTGAGSGIGELLARDLLERGDDVLVVARSAQRAEEMAAALPGARPLVADLASPATVESLDLPARLDSVVHAAGVVELGAVADLSVQAWTEQLQVNLVAPAVLTRVALPALRAARGTVVLVNSGAGLFAHPQWSAYAASKHGLRAFADSLRGEEAAHGVRVSSVYPGRTATPMQEKVHAQEGKEYDADDWVRPSTVAAAILHVLDLPGDATIPTSRSSRAEPERYSEGRERHCSAPMITIRSCVRAVSAICWASAGRSAAEMSASAVETMACTMRLERIRRSSPLQASVPGSRARSVASSRSHRSISWRMASRTASGPAVRSRAMKAKWARCRATCSTRISTERSTMPA